MSKLHWEEISCGLKTGNASASSVQNILSSGLLRKIIKIKIHITIMLPVLCMGVKLGRSD
jgi:hypothetical protein